MLGAFNDATRASSASSGKGGVGGLWRALRCSSVRRLTSSSASLPALVNSPSGMLSTSLRTAVRDGASSVCTGGVSGADCGYVAISLGVFGAAVKSTPSMVHPPWTLGVPGWLFAQPMAPSSCVPPAVANSGTLGISTLSAAGGAFARGLVLINSTTVVSSPLFVFEVSSLSTFSTAAVDVVKICFDVSYHTLVRAATISLGNLGFSKPRGAGISIPAGMGTPAALTAAI